MWNKFSDKEPGQGDRIVELQIAPNKDSFVGISFFDGAKRSREEFGWVVLWTPFPSTSPPPANTCPNCSPSGEQQATTSNNPDLLQIVYQGDEVK